MDQEILVNPQEREILIDKLKSKNFNEFKVHSHYYNRDGKPRHGIELEQAKRIFSKFDKIIRVYKRKKPDFYTYTFVYKIKKKTSYYLIFLLDEEPYKIFNAYCSGRNIEKRLFKKFGFRRRYLFSL